MSNAVLSMRGDLAYWKCAGLDQRELKPNSITLSASNQPRTMSEPASVMEFGL